MKQRRLPARSLLSIVTLFALAAGSDGASAQRASASGVEVVQLRPNIYVIGGAGGNIVVQIGPEGVILVDSGATAMADETLAAIRQLTPLPIRYIINTSMDADHVGGNEVLPGRDLGPRSEPRRSSRSTSSPPTTEPR